MFSARLHSGVSDTKEGDLNSLVNGVVNLPLADNLAARITAYYQGEEGSLIVSLARQLPPVWSCPPAPLVR